MSFSRGEGLDSESEDLRSRKVAIVRTSDVGRKIVGEMVIGDYLAELSEQLEKQPPEDSASDNI